MSAPIHIAWYNRPGVGEYGAWRVHGSHDGFDSYTLPKATIYGTADDGVVIAKGYAGGWGHYIDVRYPGYVQRDCHMNEASGLRPGAPVNRTTALGRVGQTGNAAGIRWWHKGAWLWHVHSEVYLSQFVIFSRRTNPLPIWGATTAGGGFTRIGDDEQETEQDMIKLYNTEKADAQGRRHALVGEFSFQELSLPAAQEEWDRPGDVIGVTQREWDRFRLRALSRASEFRAMLGQPVIDYEKIAAALDQMAGAPTAEDVAAEVIRQMKLPGN